MAEDPLYEALGAGPAAPDPRQGRRSGARWIAAAVLLGLLAGGAALASRPYFRATDQDIAVSRIETAPPKPITPPVPPPVAAPAPPPPPPAYGETVEIQHGVKIIRLGPATSAASVRIPVGVAAPVALARAPDPRLVEASRFGPLPKVGNDGARPADVYARPSEIGDAASAPRVALVAGGMGRDELQTAQAAQHLDPAVTLAFPPDAPDLGSQVAETRAAGHEVVLQLPDGLSAGAGASGLDALHRAMGAFPGYAGVALPPAGASGDGSTLAQDIARRGLYAIGGATAGVPRDARPPDVIIGAGDDDAVGKSLERLAAVARAKGSALGLIPQAGAIMPAVAAFTAGLAAQGLRLVPASALADQGPGAAASK